jgi:hypothetical protein
LAPAIQAQEEEHETIHHRKAIRVTGGVHGEPVVAHTFLGRGTFLGVQMVNLTPELRRHFGAPEETGVMVSRVEDESPAAVAGLQVGDIVSTVDGKPVATPSQLARAIARREEGEIVTLEVWRDGEASMLDAVLAERERSQVDIRQFHWPPEEGSHAFVLPDIEPGELIEIETEALNEAIEKLNEELAQPQWQTRLHTYQEAQGELLERLESLEKRLQEMEQQLDELPPEKE